jgi:Leucine-rich repeat (LRR) protein
MKAAVFAIYSMDQEQGFRGIPRSSRLPMPRGSHDGLRSPSPTRSLRSVASRDVLGPANLSTIPRPRTLVPTPLGENIGNSIKSRYGWSSNPKDVLSEHTGPQENQVSSVTLDTTPPGSKSVLPDFADTSENAVAHDIVIDENAALKPDVEKEKRRPRPSLSERTTETLSQISPSPSPSGRRSRTTSIETVMGPPIRPASALKIVRPPNSTTLRAASPTKFLTSPMKAPASFGSTKEPLSSPSVQSPGTIYTPPKAHVRGRSTHIAKPPKYASTTLAESHHVSSHKHSATLSKDAQIAGPKFTKPAKTISGRVSPAKPPLASIFKDPPKTKPMSTKLDLSSLNTKPQGLMKPKTRGENTVASSPTTSPNPSKPMDRLMATQKHQSTKQAEESYSKPAKSSAALREQVAKAKAEAMKKVVLRAHPAQDSTEEMSVVIGNNKGLLRKWIQGAVTTGSLNVSAMGLKQIPDEIMKMYDFDESSSINWPESVDLVKFIAADNEIREMRPDSFPDWSADDLAADEEKSNQFGGLEVLDLHGNQLSEIPVGFRRLERLQTLNLSKNKLSIDALEVICQIKNLRELNLASNSLAGTLLENIGQLKNLEVLDLSSNQLDTLPSTIASLTKLKKLNVSGNKFTSIPFGSLSSIVEINASNNKLTGTLITSSSMFENLQTLNVSGNALETISSSRDVSMPNLLTLTVDGNRLSSLPEASSIYRLVTLTASGNKLTEFPMGFDQLSAIKNADLSNNSIKTIPEGVGQMDSLSSMNLAGNPLRERKYLTMNTQDLKIDLAKRFVPLDSSAGEPFSCTTSSTALEASENSTITPLYKPVNGTLDLSGKALGEIDLTLMDLSQPVHTLNLSANNLTTFPTTLLTHPMLQYNLQTLDLSHNPLTGSTYLSTALTLPSLRTLNVISTGMTTLDALTTNLKAPTLQSLNISCHRLSGHLPWARAFWPSVTTLLATDNWFSSIDVEAVRGLEVLDVRNNEIEGLPPKLGMLGHSAASKAKGGEKGRLRSFECSGNRFRVPRWQVVEKGTEAVLRDLRRMIPAGELDSEWVDE